VKLNFSQLQDNFRTDTHLLTIHTTKPTNAPTLKFHFLHTVYHTYDMFRSISSSATYRISLKFTLKHSWNIKYICA